MYFRNRADAGRRLAIKLERLKNQNVAVVAMSEGAVIIGAQIAMRLHGSLMLLLTKNIHLPGEIDAIASLSSAGNFSYNRMFTPGQLEFMTSEYHQYIEGQRLEKRHELNVLVGRSGEIRPERLRHHVIVLVSDGLSSGLSLDIAADFLKTIKVKKLVIATPLASVSAIDKMHLVGDEICCLSVLDNYLDTNHYYDDNTIPPVKDLFRMMESISLYWDDQPESNVSSPELAPRPAAGRRSRV